VVKRALPGQSRYFALQKDLEPRESLPGVKSVGTTSVLPVSFNGNTTWIRIVGHPYNGEHNEVNQRDVSPDFFKTLKAKLLRGRYFTETDEATRPLVVIINETLARKYFPGEDPVGKRIGDTELAPKSLCEVIGVIEDVKDGPLDSETWPAVYYSSYQNADDYFALVVRTSQSEAALLPSLEAAVHEVGGGLGTLDVATMAGRINNSPTSCLHRSAAWLVGGFATLALLLGVIIIAKSTTVSSFFIMFSDQQTNHGMIVPVKTTSCSRWLRSWQLKQQGLATSSCRALHTLNCKVLSTLMLARETNPNFMNGVPELLILKLLQQDEMYGYEIVQAIRDRTGAVIAIGEGVVYPVLHGLERDGALRARRKTVNGRNRIYYSVTSRGKRRLADLSRNWVNLKNAIQAMLMGGQRGDAIP
jgi:DNA-binding PadR family transcriptional regulator